MLFACSKEEQVSVTNKGKGNGPIVFASPEGSPVTKVYADQYSILWDEEDEISLFYGNQTNNCYIFDGETGANSGSFQPDSDADIDKKVPYIYAIYPYSESTTLNSDNKLVVDLPSVQSYRVVEVEGKTGTTFGKGANTMVSAIEYPESIPEELFLPFKNVCGYLKFKFYSNNFTVKSISFQGNNGEKIAGRAVITPVVNGIPSVEMQNDATSTITIKCPESGVTLGKTSKEATEFLFVIPPVTLSKGFKITVIGTDGKVFEKATSRPLEVSRNVMNGLSPMEIKTTLNRYELVTTNDAVDDGDYVLAYHDAEGFKLFSFTKTMANAETAANNVKDVHGLSALLSKGSQIYATVVGKNYVTVEGEEGAEYIDVPNEIEEDAMLSVTGNYEAAQLTLASGSYSLRLDKVITNINDDYSATLSVQPNAPDALNIMYSLRGGTVVITFNELINFAVDQAKKEGVTFTDEQIARLRSGFLKLCKLAKEELAEHNMGNLKDIDLNTNVFDVIAQYYDNVAFYSLQVSSKKKFGWATPIGFYKGDDGFTANIALPQAGWFDRVAESLTKNNRAEFVDYWAQYDSQYGDILGISNFFQRLAGKFYDELDPSTYALLKDVDFRAIGRVYGRYVNRFNDKLEKVYLYKKVK